jgi:hypothetical protein
MPDVILIQLSTWRWGHSCSKHVEDSNKHIIEEIVRQVCHLPELYEDARSEKYKFVWLHVSTSYIRTKWNSVSQLRTERSTRRHSLEDCRLFCSIMVTVGVVHCVLPGHVNSTFWSKNCYNGGINWSSSREKMKRLRWSIGSVLAFQTRPKPSDF